MSGKRSRHRRYFDDLPAVKAPRANFNLTHRVSTTMRPGLLHPIDIVEVLPGDTWTVDTASLTKLVRPLIRPIMDDVYLDTYSFFVPLRLTYDKLEQVFGDASPSAYEEQDLASIPSIELTKNESVNEFPSSGTVYDYLGLTPDIVAPEYSTARATISALPARAFALIWNEYFRDQNVDQEVLVNLGSSFKQAEMPSKNAWSPTSYGGQLPPVRRYGDYFSTAQLAPQKGPAVSIPGIAGNPVVTSSVDTPADLFRGRESLKFGDVDGNPAGYAWNLNGFNRHLILTDDQNRVSYGPSDYALSYNGPLYPQNLVTAVGEGGTINALRLAFQLQKYLERDAFYGSRYREYLYASFGVVSQDARLTVPEFLGGSHNRLSVQQIMSTSSTADVAQGQFSGQISSLSERPLRFSKSIPEHGYIITVACIRYKHLYSQAVQKLWFRFNREDFYDRLFSNLGQKAIYDDELVGARDPSDSNNVFGYQENFAEYRTILDRVTGQMRPTDGNTGQYWSLADRFESVPTLSDLVHEQTDSFDRVLAVSQDMEHPFVLDFNFRCSVARVVSPYSMPGLADHH